MTHEELDDIFRANSERGEFAPQPGEWEEMTAMLDQDEHRERLARWVSIGWMSLFVFLIGLGIYGLWVLQSGEENTPAIAATSLSGSSLKTDGEDIASSVSPTAADLRQASRIETGDLNLSNTSEEISSNSIVSDGASAEAFAKTVNSKINKRSAFSDTEVKEENDLNKQIQVRSIASVQHQSQATSTNLSETVAATPKSTPVQRSSLILANQADQIEQQRSKSTILNVADVDHKSNEVITERPTTIALNALPSITLNPLVFTSNNPSLNEVPPVLAKAQSWSKYGVGLFFAEEVTSVAMSSYMRLGTRIGAQFHLRPLRQWSLDVGVSYAHKSYMAPEGEMQNTLNLFVDDALPFQTDGTCDLLEVPITVSFLPQGHGNAGPFISGGFLSHQIFRERMVFHFENPTNQPSSIQSNDGTGALFGTAHLQVGYRFVPRRGPSWRVGPYVQVPMKNVGVGKLPIYSGGLQVEVELF